MITTSLLFPLLLVLAIDAQDLRTIKLNKMFGIEYQCTHEHCSMSTVLFTPNLTKCQIACISNAQCRTVTFEPSSYRCELFPDMANNYGQFVLNPNVVSLVAIDDRRLSARKRLKFV